jgi:hypothetical protein
MSDLLLTRAREPLTGGSRSETDYDVFDEDRHVGRIYLVAPPRSSESWFWGVSFQVTKRKCYGYALSLEGAKEALREGYLASRGFAAERGDLRMLISSR